LLGRFNRSHARVMNRLKVLYRSWEIPCTDKQAYASCHRAEWLAKIGEPGAHRRACWTNFPP